MELFLGKLKPASHFCKKLPLRCLAGIQVRKIDDDTDNKGTSISQESIKHLGWRSFRNSQRLKSAKLSERKCTAVV